MERFGAVPNFFYDFIVFVAPTIGIAAGISLGLTGSFDIIEQWLKSIGLVGAIGMSLLIFFASYEYGRLAETYSDLFVGRVVNYVRRWGVRWLFQDSDYRRNLSEEISKLPLPELDLKDRRDSKWTVYFFALYVNPKIGEDLLKRYAWEKLARSSAFSAFVLLVASVLAFLYHVAFGPGAKLPLFQFGGIAYTGFAFLLYVILLVDYYKRNCWNNDLLMSVLPVLIANHVSNSRDSNTEVNGSVVISQR